MSRTESQQTRIDEMMEQASRSLVDRDYFACERLCVQALRRAHAVQDYGRMARILLPLQEARRQKRDLAIDTGRVRVIDCAPPVGKEIVAGCYLIVPPRVGIDGRLLRTAADERGVPAVVLVREPPTRDGLWPVVAVGPATVRTKVVPPSPPLPSPGASSGHARAGASATSASESRSGRRNKPSLKPKPGRSGTAQEAARTASAGVGPDTQPIPTPDWFIAANEALGDAAIEQVSADAPSAIRVDQLLIRLEAVPDHEKLHQALGEACRAAAQEPPPKRRPADLGFDPDSEDSIGL